MPLRGRSLRYLLYGFLALAALAFLNLERILFGIPWPTPDPPEIARGLSREIGRAGVEFDTRLKQRFPPGTAVEDLVAQLTEQGFRVDLASRRAFISYGNIACDIEWWVEWRDERGALREISGGHGASCV